MRRSILALALAAALPGAAMGQTSSQDARAIRSVILDQLDAFRSRDMERAFGHASPSIQAIFGDPGTFRRMVESGYPMVWAPDRFEVGALAEEDGELVQTMIFADGNGRLHEAAYHMEMIDGVWRINGVFVRKLPGLGS